MGMMDTYAVLTLSLTFLDPEPSSNSLTPISCPPPQPSQFLRLSLTVVLRFTRLGRPGGCGSTSRLGAGSHIPVDGDLGVTSLRSIGDLGGRHLAVGCL